MQDRIRELEQARATILAADDRLRALETHITNLEGRLEQAREERFGLQRDKKDLDGAHGDLATRQDVVNLELERIEDEDMVVLDGAGATRLDAEFAAACRPGDPTSPSGQGRVRLGSTWTRQPPRSVRGASWCSGSYPHEGFWRTPAAAAPPLRMSVLAATVRRVRATSSDLGQAFARPGFGPSRPVPNRVPLGRWSARPGPAVVREPRALTLTAEESA